MASPPAARTAATVASVEAGVEVAGDDAGPRAGEGEGAGAAQAGARPGDDDDTILEAHGPRHSTPRPTAGTPATQRKSAGKPVFRLPGASEQPE